MSAITAKGHFSQHLMENTTVLTLFTGIPSSTIEHHTSGIPSYLQHSMFTTSTYEPSHSITCPQDILLCHPRQSFYATPDILSEFALPPTPQHVLCTDSLRFAACMLCFDVCGEHALTGDSVWHYCMDDPWHTFDDCYLIDACDGMRSVRGVRKPAAVVSLTRLSCGTQGSLRPSLAEAIHLISPYCSYVSRLLFSAANHKARARSRPVFARWLSGRCRRSR